LSYSPDFLNLTFYFPILSRRLPSRRGVLPAESFDEFCIAGCLHV
jgi:hypothetical protein